MAPWVTEAVFAVVLFVSTNIDDLFLLIVLLADPAFTPYQVVFGQYLGLGSLFVASVLASRVALLAPPALVGWLGLVPIALGVKRLLAPGPDAEPVPGRARASVRVVAVALLTIASGGDNLAVYVPAFATRTTAAMANIGLGFVALTGLWCASAHALIRHPTLGAPIRRHAPRTIPWVFIAIGVHALVSQRAWSVFGG